MRVYRTACLAALIAGAGFCTAACAAPPPALKGAGFLATPGAEWRLVWNDEFDGNALNPDKWSIGLSWVGDDGTNRHHNDQYASYIADDCVAVSRGTLKLLTRRGPFSNGGRTYDYSEGLIQTDGKYAAKYGYFEVRSRVPTEAGPGMWPAFWMLPKGWPPEMDILEVWTSSNRNHQGLAYRKDNGDVGWDDTNSNAPLPTGWHTFGMEWGPGYQVYNIDRRINKRVYGTHVPAESMYIILNSGIESGRKPNAATVFPNSFEVDYVRVYQRAEGPAVLNGGFEDDRAEPWALSGRALIIGYGAESGRQALRLDDVSGAAKQVVYGLKPNTAYVVTCRARVTGGDDEARLGVSDCGGPAASGTVRSKSYSPCTVTFTTGATAVSAVVTCDKPAGEGSAIFDDVSVREG